MKYLMFIFAFLTANLFSQNTFEFLRVDVSPRVAALGGTFSAANDDPDVIFYNPAGLAYISGGPVSFSYTEHLVGIKFASFSASKGIEHFGRVGVGIKYVNYGSFTGADEDGNKLGEFGAGEVAFKGSYSNNLDDNLSYGLSAGFIYSKLADYSSTGFAIDLGLNYSIYSERINLAISLLNAGSQLSSYINTKEQLPFEIVAGLTKRLQYLPLKMYLDFHRLNQAGSISSRLKYFTFGGEFSLGKSLRLRLGYDNNKRTDLKIGNFAGLAGFNIGLGIIVGSYQVNYSYSSLGQIGAIHQFGITTSL